MLSPEMNPAEDLAPPGRPENPVELVAPVLGEIHSEEVLLRFPPTFEAAPLPSSKSSSDTGTPRYDSSVFHSSSVGTCQPAGHNPRESTTAYQLYSLPYVALLAVLLL